MTHHDGKTLDLRQGCQLVCDPERGGSRKLVRPDGREEDVALTADEALAFAEAAAGAFGVGEDLAEDFNADAAKAALKKGK